MDNSMNKTPKKPFNLFCLGSALLTAIGFAALVVRRVVVGAESENDTIWFSGALLYVFVAAFALSAVLAIWGRWTIKHNEQTGIQHSLFAIILGTLLFVAGMGEVANTFSSAKSAISVVTVLITIVFIVLYVMAVKKNKKN